VLTPRAPSVLMAVDVLTGIVIDRPRERVAAYAANASNAPEWYENIDAAEWKTSPPRCAGRIGRAWRS